MDGTVLIADDDRSLRMVLTQALTRAGCQVHATASLQTLLRWAEEGRGDLVITDVMMPDGNGLDLLPRLHQRRPGLPVIVISAQNTLVTAIRATEAAAFDYLPKPFDLPDLLQRCAKALAVKRQPVSRVKDILPPPPSSETLNDLPLIGRSAPMQALYRLMARLMASDLPVLICGETGSGKSLLARVLHDFGPRKAAGFVALSARDMLAPPGEAPSLTKAAGGTLVFEALEDFGPEAQAEALRLLDRLPQPAPRLVATAGRDLAPALQSGALREDLYYRLAGAVLTLPPLRERGEDIALLAEHFLTGTGRSLSPEAQGLLARAPWPGNLRQLAFCMQRLALTAAGDGPLDAEALRQALGQAGSGPAPQDLDGERLSASVARHLRRYFDLHGGALPPPGLYDRVLREIEAPLFDLALGATGGNQVRAADLLGLNRNTLRKRLSELDIRVTRRRKLM